MPRPTQSTHTHFQRREKALTRMSQMQLVKILRLTLPILVLMIIVLGPAIQLAYGSICTISIGSLILTCPLGFIQTSLASRSIILGLLAPVAITLATTILLGRVFCGWICPAGEAIQRLGNADILRKASNRRLMSFVQQYPTRIALLGSVLAASVILRYPVFCVVCPIGIICRNVISFSQYGSVGLDLLYIPLILALELGLGPWCTHICPIGTTLSIFSRKSPIVPVINKAKCVTCLICTKVCNMKVSLLQSPNLENCSKCLECSLRCPTKAIKWRSPTPRN